MGTRQYTTRLQGDGFSLGTWTCSHDHRGPGPENATPCTTINVVLRGMYVRHVGHRARVVDPTVALVSHPGDSWRSSHPHPVARGACADAGIWVFVAPRHCEDQRADRFRSLTPQAWLGWGSLLDGPSPDPELAVALIADALDGGLAVDREPVQVRRARIALAGRLADPPSLDELAAEVGGSPWHLCRTFRAVTGLTPRAYGEQLRLRHAARRIEGGCSDLGALARELGFSSHSHFTDRFRRVFGQVPRSLRPGFPARPLGAGFPARPLGAGFLGGAPSGVPSGGTDPA
ncbi:MAG: AraC family transcriptional regulator [Myxococcota bacterium]